MTSSREKMRELWKGKMLDPAAGHSMLLSSLLSQKSGV